LMQQRDRIAAAGDPDEIRPVLRKVPENI
jgi:hypothetical protein